MKYIDPSGNLFANHHFNMVYTECIDKTELGKWECAKLATKSMLVDFSWEALTSKDPKDTNIHNTPGINPDGRQQTPKETKEGAKKSLQNDIKSGNISGALHTGVDLNTPEHEEGPKSITIVGRIKEGLRHLYNDIFPTEETKDKARKSISDILNSFFNSEEKEDSSKKKIIRKKQLMTLRNLIKMKTFKWT